MNRLERRKANRLSRTNQNDVAATINKFAEKYNACETDQEKQAFIDSLTEQEKREINNAAVYVKLQALNKYATLPQEKREALQKGDISVL